MIALHTSPADLARIDAAARSVLDEIRAGLDAMAESRAAEAERVPVATWDEQEARRHRLLADRMERESWTEHHVQLLRDLVYLLAVGDRSAGDVARADLEAVHHEQRGTMGLLEQDHRDRHFEARERLESAGVELRAERAAAT